ncbi:unnamed protein product [Rhodiola kirilowii]
MSKGGAAATKGGKKKAVMYVINCAKPVGDKIMDIASLEKFLQERIKVGCKPGAFGDTITVMREKSKITVTADATFSKRYLKYLRLRNTSRSTMCVTGFEHGPQYFMS